MTGPEITISEALRDPMIRLLLRADRVSLEDFAKLLKDAAIRKKQSSDLADHLRLLHLH
jgi:hypothetical protein